MPDHIQPLAVITGASSGIGRELAKLAAQKGYRLLLIARNMRALEVLSRDLRTETHLLALDLTAAGAVDQISSWLSDRQIVPEIFINNAGFGAFGPASDMDEAMLKKMMRLNVMALTSLSLRMARRMKREGRGRIMNVASTAAFQPCPYLGVYGAARATCSPSPSRSQRSSRARASPSPPSVRPHAHAVRCDRGPLAGKPLRSPLRRPRTRGRNGLQGHDGGPRRRTRRRSQPLRRLHDPISSPLPRAQDRGRNAR